MMALLALLLTLVAVGYAGWAGRWRADTNELRDEMDEIGVDWQARGRSMAREWSWAAGESGPPREGSV